MEIITCDWETYYDKDYSLSKISMEEYIRSPAFEAIMLGMQMPDGTQRVITGTHEEIQFALDAIDWSKYAILCHNTLFDAAIFSWKFNVKPRLWLDTMGMARAMFGGKGNSLKALAERYGLEEKGTYVANMLGRRRESLSNDEFKHYSSYCLHDCDLTRQLFDIMSQGWYSLAPFDKRDAFPKDELRLIDKIIRMYTEPVLRLNVDKLARHHAAVVAKKELLMSKAGVDKTTLMSNTFFAEKLRELGVEPPTKISPKTGKEAFAFAKTDEGMTWLLEHPDLEVQTLASARIGVKTTIEETRALRFIGIGQRGYFPVPLRYAAARTHRLGGTDSVNLQNLPSRGLNAGVIKTCIEAPPGHVIIDCDSSNIEARGLAWLAQQNDLVEDFRNKVDVYAKMASRIYNKSINKAEHPLERFCGKTVVLGAGYQTGGVKLQNTLRVADPPMLLSEEECHGIIKTYRSTYPMIPALWRMADKAIQCMHDNTTMWLGKEGVLWVDGKKGIRGPTGLYLSYPQLHKSADGQWMYKSDYSMTNLYGGKVIENVCQHIARCIVMQQLLRIAKRYRVVLTVHDAVACVVRAEERDEAAAYMLECMRWVPPWAEGYPLDAEYGSGSNYGEC